MLQFMDIRDCTEYMHINSSCDTDLFVFILYTLFNTFIDLVKLQLAEFCGLYFLLHKICFSFSLNSVPKNHCVCNSTNIPG